MKKNLFRKWAINCALGELLGIGIAGTIAVVVNYYIGEPQSVTKRITVLLIMLGAGAIEGTSIAIFQWKILHRLFPSMKFVSWWRWTAFIALLGWGTGMLPSLFFIKPSAANNTAPSVGIIAVIAACSGAVAGALFGLFQSFELRKHSSKWKWWITANVLAWIVAMFIIFMGATLPSSTTPTVIIILSAIVSGCLSGLSLGVITGYFLFKKIIHVKQKSKPVRYSTV